MSIYDTKSNGYEIILSTNTELDANKIIQYYRLRFQIEFLIRDGKQHAGLEQCHARSEKKLDFHFNVALSSVSVAKAVYYLYHAGSKKEGYSYQSFKCLYQNNFLTDRIFSNL